jgi:hypothetical protein
MNFSETKRSASLPRPRARSNFARTEICALPVDARAVLAARLDGRWLILDNLRSELIEDSRVPNLTPVFAIDHRGVLLLAARYE